MGYLRSPMPCRAFGGCGVRQGRMGTNRMSPAEIVLLVIALFGVKVGITLAVKEWRNRKSDVWVFYDRQKTK